MPHCYELMIFGIFLSFVLQYFHFTWVVNPIHNLEFLIFFCWRSYVSNCCPLKVSWFFPIGDCMTIDSWILLFSTLFSPLILRLETVKSSMARVQAYYVHIQLCALCALFWINSLNISREINLSKTLMQFKKIRHQTWDFVLLARVTKGLSFCDVEMKWSTTKQIAIINT